MKILLVFRPDVAGDRSNPFDGIEILATASDEATINSVINAYSDENPTWQFHIDEIKLEVS